MRFLAGYWWLLVVPIALYLCVKSLIQIPRNVWVWVLRIAGAAWITGSVAWLFTGDIENQYFSLHMSGTPGGIIAPLALGVLALLVAQRLASNPKPPA